MNMRYGNKRTAKRLDQIMRRAGYPDVDEGSLSLALPEGFKYLGCGISRIAILHIATGVVYKIGYLEDNENKYDNATRLASKRLNFNLPVELRIPKTNIHYLENGEVVVTQEYANAIPTDCDAYLGRTCSCKREVCHEVARNAISHATGITDEHSGIILMDELGRYWLIDLAC